MTTSMSWRVLGASALAGALVAGSLVGCASSDAAAPVPSQASASETSTSATNQDDGDPETCAGTVFLDYDAESGEPTRAAAIELMRDTLGKTVERGWVEHDDETPYEWFVKAEFVLTGALELIDELERDAADGATVMVPVTNEQGEQIGLVSVSGGGKGYNVDGLEVDAGACDSE